MRKYIISVCLFLSFCFFANAQTWNDDMIFARKLVDSLKNDLKNVKGSERVDCFNMLSSCYFWIWDDNDKHLDSACLYANEAYNEAKKINYKRGLGYGLLQMNECTGSRADIDKTNNNKEQTNLLLEKQAQEAVKIGEEIQDYRLVGNGYGQLKEIEKRKGNLIKSKTFVQKEILNYEKPVTKPLKGLLNIATCKECQGNEILLGNRYRELAGVVASENNGNLIAANDQIEKAIYYYTMTGRTAALRSMYFHIGEMVTQTADMESGIIPYKKAIEQFQEAGDKKGEFDAHMRICRNYWNMGDFENGFSYCKKGVALAIELSKGKQDKEDDYRLGEAYYWMSRYYLIAGDFESALYFIKKTEPFYQDDFKKIVWATAIGGVYRSMGNIDSAKYYLLPLGVKSPDALGSHVGNLEPSRLYISLKEYDKAITGINQLIKREKETNNYIGLGGSLTVLSKAYLGKNETKAALNAAREGLAVIKKTKRNAILIENYETLSEIFYKMGNKDSAYLYLKQYMVLKDSLLQKQYLFKLNDYKKEAEEAKKDARLGFLDRDNKIKEQRLKQEASLKKFLIVGLILLLVAGIFIFRYFSAKRKNEKLLRDQTEQEWKLKHLESEKKQIELQRQAAELEMQALRAQMNPHFIFNCLSSINRFILKNETKTASNYLTRFSRLIRMVLINSQKPLIALEDELQMLRLYLDMERLRFKDSFNYGITFLNTMEGDNIFIPPLLLQPFCENAIWHGLMHKGDQGRLDIELSMEDTVLNCTITDNGIGREKAEGMNSKTAEKEKSMGLKITTERLALLNRDKGVQTFYEIEDLKNENGDATGTKVILKISFKESIEEMA